MAGKQHVDFHRKILMRQHLLRRWPADGAAYVPFIGDGDVAAELYADRFVCGADLDPERVATARERTAGVVLEADCDGWPFAHVEIPTIALADFDAYAEPYASFRSFWAAAPARADRLILFFTDGQRQSMMRVGKWIGPDGEHRQADKVEARPIFHSYLTKTIWPWFEDFVAPWRVVDRFRYLRGWMVYWAAVIERA